MNLRRLVAALGLALTASTLVACSSDDPSGTSNDAATTSPATPTPEPPRPPVPGDCHRLTWAQALAPSTSTQKRPCRRPTAITFHVGRLGTNAAGEIRQPDARAVQRRMTRVCPQRLADFLGGDVESRRLSVLTSVWFTPTPDEVAAGADWFRCDVVAPGVAETLVQLQPPMKGALDDQERRESYALCANGQPGTDSFSRTPCSLDHTWRAVTTVDLDKDSYPGPDTLDDQLRQPCTDTAVDAASDPLNLVWHQEVPTQAQWRGGQRYGICWLPTG